ncbi:MAG: L-carnitine dehydratase/bile acid-inducible protein, partial [Acidimicrobiales bacterium]|nr:L-carnitine dehydratase/bile acid-inducible protein [Acidimicrobiales bacterium]
IGALAALRSPRASGEGEHVDVAMLDCMTVTMTTYPSVFSSFAGWPPMTGTGRMIEVPSIEPTSDGYAVFTTNSAQQFHDFLVMMGRGDLLEDQGLARPLTRFKRRVEFLATVHEWTTKRTSADALGEAALFRIPSGPVLNGATVPAFEQFVEREVFVTAPSGRFRQPRVPYRITGWSPTPFAAAPGVGADTGQVAWDRRPARPAGEWRLPLAGVRVVDCTAWWAGPAATHVLAALGADVVKVESVTRPDLMRYSSTKLPTEDRWYEWGALFHGTNVGKRGVTLDLTDPGGIELFERLLSTADVLVENFTPRVMDQFGLGWERVHALNPDLLMVRMPAFGLDGPWRDRTGFAQTMESVAGMSWLTGFPDGPPVLVRGACDPLAGMHAVFATLVGLAGGRGAMVEAVMVEAALSAAVEQVIEHDAAGTLLCRDGNRGPTAAPQGLYRCAPAAPADGTHGDLGDDAWVAIAVEDDAQWAALCRLVGPGLDPSLATVDARRADHDAIDAALGAWCATRSADAAAGALVDAGVPAGVVISARDCRHNPQLRHRRLFEAVDHPVTGRHELPVMPFRFAHVDRWATRPAPTLGQHNDEVLGEVATPEELARLRAGGVIGDRVAGA